MIIEINRTNRLAVDARCLVLAEHLDGLPPAVAAKKYLCV